MGLLLVSLTSGLLLYATPFVATLIQYPLRVSGLMASLAGACGLSVFTPLLFRLDTHSHKYDLTSCSQDFTHDPTSCSHDFTHDYTSCSHDFTHDSTSMFFLLPHASPPLPHRPLVDQEGWRMAKAFGLILLLLVLIAVALMNFSLGVFLSLVLPLPAVMAQPCGIR